MDIDWNLLLDRALWLGIGMVIGTGFGYTVRARREAHEALEKVDRIDHELHPNGDRRDEAGFMRNPILADIAMFVVVVVTVWAAIGSTVVSSKLDRTVDCLEQFSTTVAKANAERDGDASDTLNAEITLWRKYDRLYQLAKKADSAGDEKELAKLQDKFYRTVNHYRSNLVELRRTRKEQPYPTPQSLHLCTTK